MEAVTGVDPLDPWNWRRRWRQKKRWRQGAFFCPVALLDINHDSILISLDMSWVETGYEFDASTIFWQCSSMFSGHVFFSGSCHGLAAQAARNEKSLVSVKSKVDFLDTEGNKSSSVTAKSEIWGCSKLSHKLLAHKLRLVIVFRKLILSVEKIWDNYRTCSKVDGLAQNLAMIFPHVQKKW